MLAAQPAAPLRASGSHGPDELDALGGAQLTAEQATERERTDTSRTASGDASRARRFGDPPSLGEQFGRTRAALGRLFSSHIALLRAELGEIFALIRWLAILAGIALFAALLLAVTLYVGGFLFLGEWLFGSIGWGVAHGSLFAIGLIVMLGLAIVGASRTRGLAAFALALVLTVGLALLLGSNVLYDAASQVAQRLAAPLDAAAVPAGIVGALLLGLLLAFVLWGAAGGGGAMLGLIGGALLGAVLGALLGGIAWEWQPAVGLAITLGLLLWSILQVVLAWPSIDLSKRAGQLYPRQTMETAAESREWLGRQWARRRPTLGRK